MTLRRELATRNPEALDRAYVGPGIFLSPPGADGRETNEALSLKGEYEALGGSFVVVDRPTELFPGAWLTGPVPRTYPERTGVSSARSRTTMADWSRTTSPRTCRWCSIPIRAWSFLGCGHAGIINTLEYARRRSARPAIHAALGGFHLSRPMRDARLDGR